MSVHSTECSIQSEQSSFAERYDKASPPVKTPIRNIIGLPEHLKKSDSRRTFSGKQSSKTFPDDGLGAPSVQAKYIGVDDSLPGPVREPTGAPTRKVKLPDFLKKGKPCKKRPSRKKVHLERSSMLPSYEAKFQTPSSKTTEAASVGKVEVPETFKKGHRLSDIFKHSLGPSSHHSQNSITTPQNVSQGHMEEQRMSESSEPTFAAESNCTHKKMGKVRVPEKFQATNSSERRLTCSQQNLSKFTCKKMESQASHPETIVLTNLIPYAPEDDVLSEKEPSLPWDRSSKHDTQDFLSGRLLHRRSSFSDLNNPSFVRPVTPERRIARRASTGRLRIDDLRDARYWEVKITHAVQIAHIKDMVNPELKDTESRPRPAPPRRVVRRHSTGSLSNRSNESDDMIVDFWHTYESESEDSRPPQDPLKKSYSRRRAVRFDSSVTVWIFTKEDTPFECDLRLSQSFLSSNSAVDTAPKAPRRIDTAPKAPIRRTNSNDNKIPAISSRSNTSIRLPSSNLELSKPSRKPSGDGLVDMVHGEVSDLIPKNVGVFKHPRPQELFRSNTSGSISTSASGQRSSVEGAKNEEDTASVDTWSPDEDRPLKKVWFADENEVHYFEKWIAPEIILHQPGIVFCAANVDCAPKAPCRLEMMESIDDTFRQLRDYEKKERKSRQMDLMPCQPRRRCSFSSQPCGDDNASESMGISFNTIADSDVLVCTQQFQDDSCCDKRKNLPKSTHITRVEGLGLEGCVAPRDIAIGPKRWDSSNHLDQQNVFPKDFAVNVGTSRWDSDDFLKLDERSVNDTHLSLPMLSQTERVEAPNVKMRSMRTLKYDSDRNFSESEGKLEDQLVNLRPAATFIKRDQLFVETGDGGGDINITTESRPTLESSENSDTSLSRVGTLKPEISRGFGTERWDSLKSFATEDMEAITMNVSASPHLWTSKWNNLYSQPELTRLDSTSTSGPEHISYSEVCSSVQTNREGRFFDQDSNIPLSKLESAEGHTNERNSETKASIDLIGNSVSPSKLCHGRKGLALVVGPSGWDSARNFDEQKEYEGFRSDELPIIQELDGRVAYTHDRLGNHRCESKRCLLTNDSYSPDGAELERVDSSRSLLTDAIIFELEEESDHSEYGAQPEEQPNLPSSLIRPLSLKGNFLRTSRGRWDSTRSLVANDTIFEEDESERSLVSDDKAQEKALTAPLMPATVFPMPSRNLTFVSNRNLTSPERWDSSRSLIVDDVTSELDPTRAPEAASLSESYSTFENRHLFRGICVGRSDLTKSCFTTSAVHSFLPRACRERAELLNSTSSLTTDDLHDCTPSAEKDSFVNRYDSARSLTIDDVGFKEVVPSIRENSFGNRQEKQASTCLTTDHILEDTPYRKMSISQGGCITSLNLGDIAGDESVSIQSSVSHICPENVMSISIPSLDVDWSTDLNESIVDNESVIDNSKMPLVGTSISDGPMNGRGPRALNISVDSEHQNTLRPGKWRGDSTRTILSRDSSDRSLTDTSYVSRQSSSRSLVGRNNPGRSFLDRDRSGKGLIARKDSGIGINMIREPSGRCLVGRNDSGIREDSNRSLVSDTCHKVFCHRLQPHRVPSFAKRPTTWRGDSIQNLAASEDSSVYKNSPENSLVDTVPDAQSDSAF